MKITEIATQVKHNCDISDAKFWGYFSLCGLLLRLRELYRAEHNIAPWSSINQNEIGEWITAKEALWSEIEDQDFKELIIDGNTFNPFDVSTINSHLIKDNLFYGAGFGLYKKPVFFFGELYSSFNSLNYNAYYINKEYARDLFNVSGMLQENNILIRLEQLRVVLWEMFLEFKCKKDSFIANIFSGSGIGPEDDINDEFEIKLDNLALKYSDIILNHELGEAFESADEWLSIILRIQDRKAEYFLRGLKDMIADTSEYGTLKKLIDSEDIAGLAFYIALADFYHKSLCPELKKVLASLQYTADWGLLDSIRQKVYARCISLKNKILDANRKSRNENEFLQMIRNLY